MRAMIIRQYGPPEVLEPTELPLPQPAPGEVRVQVHAVSINPVDYKRRQNWAGQALPVILGWDVSGVVDALGEGVKDFAVGDAVYGMLRFPHEGRAYAEYVTAPVTDIALKPASLSHEEAAAMTLAPLTAWQAFERMDLRAGQTVLIHAGAGGVGHFAVQLARARGARVIATGSAANRDFILGLGADEVVDYRARPFEEQVRNVDAVLDTVGGDTFTRSFGVVRPGGWVVSIVTRPTDEHAALAHDLGVRAEWILVTPSRAQLEGLSALAESGQLKPHVSQTFPLAEVTEAHRAQATGRSVGKLVLTVR
ncbi:NADP-dependent oxidoreductase [Deinococcus hopiensis]|uniref:NADPH:quinone reductase n=1 Tax=Deinococcus hopiensis KR-140 TaxID=695939 RepID=A0A1W1UDU4_9DEIO|nr:NADP-dependent oxidoreductase [Deinococcus hopiensis]SMB79202.1 NADPH:quinone reductase [Deinococcus hopiensis KR-140]